MLIYCFSEMCCYWSSCWGLLQSFLETVLTALCFWQIYGQGLHSPKEAEESWVMMAQTFCCLERDLSNLCLLSLRGSENEESSVLVQRTAFPSSHTPLGDTGTPPAHPDCTWQSRISVNALPSSFLSSWVQQQSRFGISSLQASLLSHIHCTETQITT